MKKLVPPAAMAIIVAFAAPVVAMPAPSAMEGVRALPITQAQYDPYAYRRHHPRYGGTVGANGGYKVNRYGFGNYVRGPGGFAGYPAGSAGAQIYRQKQEWKCQNVPETC